MTLDTIISETKRRFKLVRDVEGNQVILGRGLTSTVYKVREEPPGEIFYAAKVPFTNLLASTLEDFRNEIVILQAVYEKCRSKKFVPEAFLSRDPAQPDLSIILMEYVPPDWRLSKLFASSDQRLPEDIGLKTGLQYVQMLQVLHEARYFTHGDRKAGDLHWDQANDRLIVLDWNRARKLPQDAELQKESIRQDIRIFAQLWAELMLGRRVHSLPDPDDVADHIWAELSLGARTILEKAYSNRSEHWYEGTVDIERDLLEHIDRTELARGKPKQLLDQAEELHRQAIKEKGTYQRSDLARRVLIIADLITRNAKADSGVDRQRIEVLAYSAREIIQSTRVAFDQKIKEIKNLVDNGQYPLARDTLGRELAAIEIGRSAEETQARIQFRRWLALCKVAILSADARVAKGRERVRQISDAMAELQSEIQAFPAKDPIELNRQLKKLSDRIELASSDFGDAVNAETIGDLRAGVALVQREMVVRQNCVAALANVDRPDLEKQSLEGAIAAWNELQAQDPAQAEDLVKTLRNLEEHIESKTLQKIEERRIEKGRDDFRLQMEEIVQALQNSSISDKSLPELVNRIDTAIESYRRDLAEDESANQDELREYYALACSIRTICSDIGQNIPQALRTAQQIPERTGVRSILIRLSAQAAAERLKQITGNSPCWPFELLEGGRLIKCLDEVREVIEEENWWKDWLNNYAPIFGKRLCELNSWHELGAQILSVKSKSLDDALEQAKKIGIEFGSSEEEQLSVLDIMLARSGVKMSDETKRHTDELKKSIEGMDSKMQELVKKKDELNTVIEQANALAGRIEGLSFPEVDTIIRSSQTKLDQIVGNSQSKLHKFVTESETAIDKVTTTLDKKQEEVRQLTENANFAQGYIRPVLRDLYVSLATSAAMELNAKDARRYCDLATYNHQAESNPELDALDELVQWLEETAKILTRFNDLRDWKDALRSLNQTEAEKCYNTLLTYLSSRDWSRPIVARILMEHKALFSAGASNVIAVEGQDTSQSESQRKFQEFERRAWDLLFRPLEAKPGEPLDSNEPNRPLDVINPLDELEKEIHQQYSCIHTPNEAEVLQKYEGWLEHARRMHEDLKTAKSLIDKDQPGYAWEILQRIFDTTNTGVFGSQYEEWKSQLTRVNQSGTLDVKSLLDKGEKKAESARQVCVFFSTDHRDSLVEGAS